MTNSEGFFATRLGPTNRARQGHWADEEIYSGDMLKVRRR